MHTAAAAALYVTERAGVQPIGRIGCAPCTRNFGSVAFASRCFNFVQYSRSCSLYDR